MPMVWLALARRSEPYSSVVAYTLARAVVLLRVSARPYTLKVGHTGLRVAPA